MRDTEGVPGTHSPEKKINLLFLDLSWLASPGPESTVQASIEGKM